MKAPPEKFWLKLGSLFLIILVAVTCGGCWDRMEIEDIAFISAVGVDRAGSGEILVTFMVVNPYALNKQTGGGGGDEQSPVYVASVQARDFSQALQKYAEESSRRVSFKQLQVVILGEDLTREGVGPVIDFLARYHEMRRSIWVLVAKGKAQDILVKGQAAPEPLLSSGIKTVMDRGPDLTATRYPVVLGDFLTSLARMGQEPIASSIELYPMREASTEGGNAGGQGGASAEGQAAEKNKQIAFKGAAVFRHDQLLDFLGPSETRGVLWLQGKVRGGFITVSAPATQGALASLKIDNETTQIKPIVEKNKIRFQVTINEWGHVSSVGGKELALDKPEVLEMLEREKEKAITQEVMGAVKKAQELKSDFLWLGDRLYRKHPAVWDKIKDDWNTDWFPQAEIDLKVTCELKWLGSTVEPVQYETPAR